MESSSENSFTWTGTSSDSIDSQSMDRDVSVVDKSLEYGKHKQRKSICNESETELKPKVKTEDQKNCETNHNLQKKMVKVEPESDCDRTRKRKKVKHYEANGSVDELHNSTSYDESYLNVRVKEEKVMVSLLDNKLKIKKNHSSNVDDNYSEIKPVMAEEANESLNISFETKTKIKKKKKKLKRKLENESYEEMQMSSNRDGEDAVENKNIDSGSDISSSRMIRSSIAENTFNNETGCNEISAIQCEDHNLHTLSINLQNSSENENKKRISQLKTDKDVEHRAVEHSRPRLSDRIRFEDEDDYETGLVHNNHNKEDNISLKLTKFIKTENKMKLISQELHQNCALTCDDELWLVQCPRDIDVQDFCDIDLNMHGKTKIKLSGQTYDGTLDNAECDTTAVLTTQHGDYGIDNLPLSGIIKLRKRIPKAHFRDDNIMVNNQTNFIPLPETKCRHPLFGANYKKAIKVPAAVAQQLNLHNEVEEIAPTKEKRKKKKHKTDKIVLEFTETDPKYDITVMPEPQLTVTTKKKKKRKHMDDEEGPAPKKVKKLKHDPESEEAWDSEKAIEQNLFNF